jgi:hypothetical protein
MHGQILQRAFSLERTVDNVTELNLRYFFCFNSCFCEVREKRYTTAAVWPQ